MSAGMAYEAMNNAGAMHSRLIVILNDNDMSIAPPVGAMSAYLARLVSGGTYRGLARDGEAARQEAAEFLLREGGARRGIRPRILDRRHHVRGARLLLCRPDRRAQPRPPAADAQERARRRDGTDPRPCRHPEGQGLRPGGGFRRQVSRRRHLRRGDGRAGEAEGQRARLHQGVRREPHQGGAEGRQDRRDHGGDAVGHRHRPLREASSRPAPSMSASPSSTP